MQNTKQLENNISKLSPLYNFCSNEAISETVENIDIIKDKQNKYLLVKLKKFEKNIFVIKGENCTVEDLHITFPEKYEDGTGYCSLYHMSIHFASYVIHRYEDQDGYKSKLKIKDKNNNTYLELDHNQYANVEKLIEENLEPILQKIKKLHQEKLKFLEEEFNALLESHQDSNFQNASKVTQTENSNICDSIPAISQEIQDPETTIQKLLSLITEIKNISYTKTRLNKQSNNLFAEQRLLQQNIKIKNEVNTPTIYEDFTESTENDRKLDSENFSSEIVKIPEYHPQEKSNTADEIEIIINESFETIKKINNSFKPEKFNDKTTDKFEYIKEINNEIQKLKDNVLYFDCYEHETDYDINQINFIKTFEKKNYETFKNQATKYLEAILNIEKTLKTQGDILIPFAKHISHERVIILLKFDQVWGLKYFIDNANISLNDYKLEVQLSSDSSEEMSLFSAIFHFKAIKCLECLMVNYSESIDYHAPYSGLPTSFAILELGVKDEFRISFLKALLPTQTISKEFYNAMHKSMRECFAIHKYTEDKKKALLSKLEIYKTNINKLAIYNKELHNFNLKLINNIDSNLIESVRKNEDFIQLVDRQKKLQESINKILLKNQSLAIDINQNTTKIMSYFKDNDLIDMQINELGEAEFIKVIEEHNKYLDNYDQLLQNLVILLQYKNRNHVNKNERKTMNNTKSQILLLQKLMKEYEDKYFIPSNDLQDEDENENELNKFLKTLNDIKNEIEGIVNYLKENGLYTNSINSIDSKKDDEDEYQNLNFEETAENDANNVSSNICNP